MIAAIINMPEIERSVIVVVIEPENLERMRKGDPATLETKSLGGILPPIAYPENYGVLVAYDENDVELYKQARAGTLLHYLEQGRKFLRQDGTDKSFVIPQEK